MYALFGYEISSVGCTAMGKYPNFLANSRQDQNILKKNMYQAQNLDLFSRIPYIKHYGDFEVLVAFELEFI